MKIISKKNKPTLVCYLLDRSGSMEQCKEETINGFNSYIEELQNKDENILFTLTQFDSQGIDITYDAVALKKVKKLDFKPRSWTPLYDAIGKTIRSAEKLEKKYKILFVTTSDGKENCSKEWNLDSVKKLIKEKEDKNKWTFAYIGVGIEGWEQLKTLSIGTKSASNLISSDKSELKSTYSRFAGQTVNYSNSNNIGSVVTDFWNPDSK